jgi:hypothetical protein
VSNIPKGARLASGAYLTGRPSGKFGAIKTACHFGHTHEVGGLIPTEHEEQVALFQWAAINERKYPELGLMFAVPNAGAGSQKGRAGWLKAEGVKSGVPDIFLPTARRDKHGLFIELKRRKLRSHKPEQKEWMAALIAQGYECWLCAGWEAASRVIEGYLEGII